MQLLYVNSLHNRQIMHIHRNGGNDRFHFFPSFPSFSYSKHLAEESGLRKHEIFPISLSNLFSSISNLTSQQSLAALRISNSSGREEEINSPFSPRVNFNQTNKMETRGKKKKKRRERREKERKRFRFLEERR